MSAQWFCQFVEERREDGATFAMLARELDDPRRSIRFTEESVESLYRDLSGKLSQANRYWREEGLEAPPVAPKPPVETGPQAQTTSVPVIPPLKDWSVNGAGLASRMNRLKESQTGPAAPAAGADGASDDNDRDDDSTLGGGFRPR